MEHNYVIKKEEFPGSLSKGVNSRQCEKKKDFFVGQFTKNLGSNLLLFFINVSVGLWMIPYLIHNLGVAAYGIIPLAMSFTHYVALVTLAVSGGISRFITIDLQQGRFDDANKTFNTSFWSLLVLMLASLPLLALLIHYVPILFNIPAEHLNSSKWLFAGVMGAFLITTFSSSFSASTFAYNRLDLSNYGQLIVVLIRVMVLIILFRLLKPSLGYFSVATFFAACIGFILNIFFWKKLTPELSISLSAFELSRLKDLISMGGWLVINQIGSLLFLQIDLIVVNRLFGPTAGGEYASVLQWNMLIRTMAGVFSGVLMPIYMIAYARGEKDNLIKLSKLAVKFMGLGLALPIGLACGLSSELLTVWIGPEFSRLASLMVLMLVHLAVNLAVTPLFSINVCFNKVRIPGIITLLMGCMNVALALIFPMVFHTGFYGVALAGAIVLTLKNAFFTPWYTSRVLQVSPRAFLFEMGVGVIMTLAVFGVSSLSSLLWNINTWGKLIIAGSGVGFIYIPIIWRFVLSQSERSLFKKMMRRNKHGAA